MVRDSIYKPIFERKSQRLHLGFDYQDKIIEKTTSSQLFGINPHLTRFLTDLNKIMFEHIEAVKQIKIFANIAVDKFENKIN